MVCCAGNVVWCEMTVELRWCLRCGMYTHCHCHLAPHHLITTTFFIASFHAKHHLWHSTPHPTSLHHFSPYHTNTYSLCNTIFLNRTLSATLCITRRLALHPISHYVPHNATFQITPSIGHIIAPPHLASYFVQPHFTCSTSWIIASFHHILPWSHPTAMFHITFHIAH